MSTDPGPGTRSPWRRALPIGILGAFAVGVLLSATVRSHLSVTVPPQETTETQRERDYAGALWLVFIGSPDCAWSVDPRVHASLDSISRVAQRFADEHDLRLRSVGISPNSSGHIGAAYLSRILPFDEVFAGGGWDNVGLRRFVWDLGLGGAVTPQVLLLRGETNSFQNEDLGPTLRIVATMTGPFEMVRWLVDPRF